jgi:hypothetical protein
VVQAGMTETTRVNELRREAYTMAFYVAVCLIAALLAIDSDVHQPTLVIIWGTAIGLAVAHLFAFRLAGRLVGTAQADPELARLASAQLAGAAAVAAIATVPAVLVPPPHDVEVSRLVLSGVIGLGAYVVARASGAGKLRSTVFGLSVLAAGVTVALVKNLLIGH